MLSGGSYISGWEVWVESYAQWDMGRGESGEDGIKLQDCCTLLFLGLSSPLKRGIWHRYKRLKFCCVGDLAWNKLKRVRK